MAASPDQTDATARDATASALGANPIIGVSREELADAAARLLRLLSLNPLTVLRVQAAFAAEAAGIALGRSRRSPDAHDRRFTHPVWQQHGYYRRLLQWYLAWGDSLNAILDGIDAPEDDMERARFALNQIIAAAAPSNNPLGNPGFIDNLRKSRGQSLLRGLRHLASDLLTNGGMPSQVDARPFTLGGNLATTPGAVVFRNAVCEVIQYTPATDRVDATPLLLIPPQINKYYIVDITEHKSLVRYAVAHGIQMFCISWRNPTAAQSDWNMDTYVQAAHEALDAVLEITGADSAKLMAACAGGFTAALLTAYLQAIGEQDKVACLTLLVTVLDTSEKTLLGLFANDASIKAAAAASRRRGVLDGAQMARAFAWLRPEDLVWNFVANNYVLGNDPPAFDILYWNNDTTRLPAGFHADILNLFKRNPLVTPGAMQVLGEAIDLKQVNCDLFIIAGITDHITPWQACYRSTRMFGGAVRFVLSSSGHIQSIVNPPGNPKARYFEHDDYSLPAPQWLEQASEQPGSWWQPWLEWARAHSAGETDAPAHLGSEAHPPGMPAPGRYVFQR